MIWPGGKSFAFTVFDDTDRATVENVKPVYDLLADLGIMTTKSVWALDPETEPRIGGATCEDDAYRAWTIDLQAKGFEIGSHGATPGTTSRARIHESLDRFRKIYGHNPSTFANHAGCMESIYWGEDRVSGASRLAYGVMTGFRRRGMSRGHLESDPLFWGDLCNERIRYVRNFTYRDIDTLAACPVMPYHDSERPYVQAWFASSEGADVEAFCTCVSEAAQERLVAAGSACIMYTHFAAGFVVDGRIEPRFRHLMERLARADGWFVPVAQLLDHLAEKRGVVTLRPDQRRVLEWRWLLSKARVGPS